MFGYIGGSVGGYPYWGGSLGSYASLGVDLGDLHRAAEDLLERALADVKDETGDVEVDAPGKPLRNAFRACTKSRWSCTSSLVSGLGKPSMNSRSQACSRPA